MISLFRISFIMKKRRNGHISEQYQNVETQLIASLLIVRMHPAQNEINSEIGDEHT